MSRVDWLLIVVEILAFGVFTEAVYQVAGMWPAIGMCALVAVTLIERLRWEITDVRTETPEQSQPT